MVTISEFDEQIEKVKERSAAFRQTSTARTEAQKVVEEAQQQLDAATELSTAAKIALIDESRKLMTMIEGFSTPAEEEAEAAKSGKAKGGK